MKIANKLIYVIAIVLAIFLYKQCSQDPEVIEVPVRIEVPIPIVEVQHDTVDNPIPIYVPGEIQIDSTYYNEYVKLKDSIKKDSLFREAIKINEYREKIEDDTLTINLYAKTRGELLQYQVGYKTKPRNIKLDTTIVIDNPKKAELYGGFAVSLSTDENGKSTPGIGPSLNLINKKHSKNFTVIWDVVNKELLVGVNFRF